MSNFCLKRNRFWGGMFVFILLASLSASGCEPLRKKFIRQKKKDKDSSAALNPILEPIEYPEKIHTAKDDYKKHYSLWQVWFRELITDLEESNSLKRQSYNLSQIIKELAEMRKLLPAEKQSRLSNIIDQFKTLQPSLEDASIQANTSSVKLKAESLGKQVREQFRFKQVEVDLAVKGQ